MKDRTIEKILASKHRTWCESITDEAVRKLAQEQTIITGGSIVSLYQNEEVNDYDIYLRSPEAALAIAKYYVGKLLENPPPAFKDAPDHKVEIYALLEKAVAEGQTEKRINGVVTGPLPPRVRVVVKSAGVAGATEQKDYQYFEGTPAAEQAALTEAYVGAAMGEPAEGQITDDTEPNDDEAGAGYEQATTELDDLPAKAIEPEPPETKEEKEDAAKRGRYRVLFVTSNAITLSDKVQIIIRFQGDPATIHENYDFLHCCSYWCSWERKLVTTVETLRAIMSKELRYVGSKYPLCSCIRLRKFIARGWTINAGQIIKMLWQVNQLKLSDPMVLEDQLVGVDSAYFAQVISALKARMDKQAAETGVMPEVDGTYLLTLVDRVFG
jgi:hypothetical protein